MATFIFTHNDLDGAGSAVVVKRKMLENVHITYHTYETIDSALQNILKEENHKQDELIIADICPREETCELINQNLHRFTSVALYDHHKTRSWVQKYPWAFYKENGCGTSIVASEIGQLIEVQDFVASIKAWDLWELESPFRSRGENLNTILGFLGIEKFVSVFSRDINADSTNELTFATSAINNRKNRYVESVLKDQLAKARTYPDGLGSKFKILFATDFISEIAACALNHPNGEDLDYICVINPVSNTCSLRSRQGEDIDVSRIAKEVRGGGHKNAAGFPVKMTTVIENMVFKILNSINY